MAALGRKKGGVPMLVWVVLALLVVWAAVYAGQRGKLFRTPPPDDPAAATYGANPPPTNEAPHYPPQ